MNLLENEMASRDSRKRMLVEHWAPNFLSKVGIDDKYEQLDFALLLDNHKKDIISTKVALMVWRRLILHKMASVQPLFSREDCYYKLDYGNEVYMSEHQITTNKYNYKENYGNDVELMAEGIAMELNRRGINTMMSYAGINNLCDFSGIESIRDRRGILIDSIFETSDEMIMRNNHGGVTWMVTSPEIASIFVDSINFFTNSLFISRIGFLAGIEIYQDPLFPSSRILLGHKGNHPYDSGYFYCPFTMVNRKDGLYAEEYHGLSEGGENYYATLTIANLF